MLGLVLCCCHLEIPKTLTLEFAFCKWSPVGQRSIFPRSGDALEQQTAHVLVVQLAAGTHTGWGTAGSAHPVALVQLHTSEQSRVPWDPEGVGMLGHGPRWGV